MGGTTHLRVGHAGAFAANAAGFKKEKRASSCSASQFYKAPTAGQSIDSLQALPIKWDTSCLSPSAGKVDIYLYAPATSKPLLHAFQNVDFSKGEYDAPVMPRWWNATNSVSLNLAIVEAGQPTFMSSIGPGPQFTATYAKPSDGSTPAAADTSKVDSGITDVSGQSVAAASAGAGESHGLSGGKIAAAVLVPVLFVIGLIVLAYLRIQRQKRNEASQRYSAAIDRRMSTISSDWKSMTPSGGQVRASMAQNEGSRFSTFSWSNGARPASSVNAVEGGQAGLGSRGMYHHNNSSIANYDYVNGYNGQAQPRHQPRQMSQSSNVMRPSFSTSRVSFADGSAPARKSVVSFADGGSTRLSRYSAYDNAPRPSVDSRRSQYSQATNVNERGSRAYHTSFNVDTNAPPVPAMLSRHDSDTLGHPEGLMSPKQTAGAVSLREEDVQRGATMSMADGPDIEGALALMQTSPQSTELLFSAPQTPGPDSADKRMSLSVPAQVIYAPPASPRIQQQTSPLGPMPMLSPAPSMEEQGGHGGQEKYMSPDEMLAAYARSKQQGTQGQAGNGMRQLYNAAPAGHKKAESAAWGEGDAYGGTA